MNRYNIRIDGEVMPNSYSYEELLLNDILDFDDIEVKQVSKTKWTNIKSFYFPEEHDEEQASVDNFSIGEDGQLHFKKQKETEKNQAQQEYVIDEFGQVVSQNNIGGGSNSNSTSRTDTPTTSRTTTSSSSSSDDNTGWKIFWTIVAIIVFIAITCTTGWGSIPAGIVGYWTLKTIWSDDL